MKDGTSEATMEELREFMEGDALEMPANPEFKERLRRNLWEMVRLRFKKPRPDA